MRVHHDIASLAHLTTVGPGVAAVPPVVTVRTLELAPNTRFPLIRSFLESLIAGELSI